MAKFQQIGHRIGGRELTQDKGEFVWCRERDYTGTIARSHTLDGL